MRKAMGPILTTGVALVAAAVVVANPVAPPVRDLQISTTQLSTSPEALIPFDKNLLNSISQPSAVSGFNTALAQILGALAAEADRISSEVTSGSSSAPLPSATAVQASAVYNPVPGEPGPLPTPNGAPTASSTLSQASAAASTPGIQQIVSDLAADTTYLGNKVVEAAYAAVNAIVNTPNLVVKVVYAFFKGDLPGAIDAVIEAIQAFFNPGLILAGGIDGILGRLAPQLIPPTPGATAAAVNSAETSTSADPTPGGSGTPATDPAPATVAAPGTNKPRDTKSTGGTKRAAAPADLTPAPLSAAASAAAQPQTRTSSSAGAPGTGNPSRSAAPATIGRAEPPAPGADNSGSGADKPGPGQGRGQSAGGRGASASG